MAFYKRIMVPGNAALVVVGDVRPDTITAALEARLRTWSPGPVPAGSVGLRLRRRRRAGRLPDRQAGRRPVGLERGQDRCGPQIARFLHLESDERDPRRPVCQPDQYEPSRGQGLQLRGASRDFSFLRGPGPFEASATVQTAVTKESLVEIMKELTDITGRRPVTDAELSFAKQGIIQGFPSRFETTFGVAGQIANLVDRRPARR